MKLDTARENQQQYRWVIDDVEDSKEPTLDANRFTVSANKASISSNWVLDTIFSKLLFKIEFSVSNPTFDVRTVIYSLPASSKLYVIANEAFSYNCST